MSWQSREELAHQVVTLKAQGMASRAIARSVGVSRNTVKSLLLAHQEEREAGHAALPQRPDRVPRAQKLDAFKPKIAALTARFADITAQRVFEILRADGFDGGYTVVKKYMRSVRPPKKPAQSLMTPDYGPAEMGESDWSPYEVTFTTGKRAVVQALSYVLVHSTRKFFELYESNDLHALMDGHAFERFEGCAEQCKYPPVSGRVVGQSGRRPGSLRYPGGENRPLRCPRCILLNSEMKCSRS
jgi:transposase